MSDGWYSCRRHYTTKYVDRDRKLVVYLTVSLLNDSLHLQLHDSRYKIAPWLQLCSSQSRSLSLLVVYSIPALSFSTSITLVTLLRLDVSIIKTSILLESSSSLPSLLARHTNTSLVFAVFPSVAVVKECLLRPC